MTDESTWYYWEERCACCGGSGRHTRYDETDLPLDQPRPCLFCDGTGRMTHRASAIPTQGWAPMGPVTTFVDGQEVVVVPAAQTSPDTARDT